MGKKPLVSVFAPTFNCEKFVCAMIDSFLAQSYDNFELIIVDDCSSDNICEKVKKYKDSRVKLIQHDWNKGVNAALNTAFENSEGNYIAFSAGDDMVTPTYLEKIVREFEQNESCGVIYTSLILVNELGEAIVPQPKWALQKEKSRVDLLKDLFYENNVLLSPGMAVRREVIRDFMPLNIALSAYQDYFLHVNFLIRTSPYFLPSPEYYYRRSEKSLSVRRDSYWRAEQETSILMNAFLQIKDINFLRQILQNDAVDIKHRELIPYYVGVSAIRSVHTERQKWGYIIILNFISNESNYEILHKLTGFSYGKLLNISVDLYRKNKEKVKRKRLKKYMIVFCALFLLFLVGCLMLI